MVRMYDINTYLQLKKVWLKCTKVMVGPWLSSISFIILWTSSQSRHWNSGQYQLKTRESSSKNTSGSQSNSLIELLDTIKLIKDVIVSMLEILTVEVY